jgi:hypothetical protein
MLMRCLFAVIVLIAASSVAFADSGYTVDMTTVLHDEGGKPIKDPSENAATVPGPDGKPTLVDPDCLKCPPLTLGAAVASALFMPDRDASGAELWTRGTLATRVRTEKAATLTATEVTLIEKLLAKRYPAPIIIMQAYPLLDPNSKPGEVK